MAKGNSPDTSDYKQTAINTKAHNHVNDTQYGATGGDSDEKDTKRQEMAGAPTFQGRQRSKKSKVLPSRQDFNGSVQQSNVSSATPTLQDVEENKDLECISKVFSYGIDGVDDLDTDTPANAHPYSNDEIVNDLLSQDKDQPVGAVYTEDVKIAEETQSPQNQEKNGELVCEKKAIPCVTNILPSSKNYEDPVDPMWLTKLIALKHKERLTVTEKCGICENGFHPTVKHDFLSHQAEGEKVLEHCKQKVGIVQCQTCGDLGTCFRIGKCNIATCWHVISKCTNHTIKVIFDHQGPNQRDMWVYTIREKSIDTNLDFAVFELCSNGENFPPAFTKFRDSTHVDGSNERLVYLLCFQKEATGQSKLDVHCDTVRLNRNTLDHDSLYKHNLMVMEKCPKYTSKGLPYGNANLHRDKGHVPLLCEVIHGGSGGVGVFLDGNGDVVVDFMYRQGYPGFFYDIDTDIALTRDEKEKFPGCFRMEVGLDIRTMMEKSDQGLWESGQ